MSPTLEIISKWQESWTQAATKSVDVGLVNCCKGQHVQAEGASPLSLEIFPKADIYMRLRGEAKMQRLWIEVDFFFFFF